MSKKIVYIATDNGIDGCAPTSVMYASFDEHERNAMVDADKAKAWRGKSDLIIDVNLARNKALSKLDGIDRLVLGFPAWPNNNLEMVESSEQMQ